MAVQQPALHAREAYLLESDEVLGEPRPLSVLLLVAWAASSAAAVIDMIRSSSGEEEKRSQFTQTDRQSDRRVDLNVCAAFTLRLHKAFAYRSILMLYDSWIAKNVTLSNQHLPTN